MKRGESAESPRVSRSRLTTAFGPWSKSTTCRSARSLPQFIARDEISGSVEQDRQNTKRLLLQVDLVPALRSSPRAQVQLEQAEPGDVSVYVEKSGIGTPVRALEQCGWAPEPSTSMPDRSLTGDVQEPR